MRMTNVKNQLTDSNPRINTNNHLYSYFKNQPQRVRQKLVKHFTRGPTPSNAGKGYPLLRTFWFGYHQKDFPTKQQASVGSISPAYSINGYNLTDALGNSDNGKQIVQKSPAVAAVLLRIGHGNGGF